MAAVNVYDLAGYRRCLEHMRAAWRPFAARRRQWLAQDGRGGPAVEKVAENILQDLFTNVLDWSISDVNNQLGRADLVLAHLGMRRLIVEVKRPGSLAWGRRSVDEALDQARRYAGELRVRQVAVSDGCLLYAAQIAGGGLRDRLLTRLDADEPPPDLWWISADGIYRPRPDAEVAEVARRLQAAAADPVPEASPHGDALLHHKYRLPARCFAYVGDASRPSTWHLPYLLADGSIDGRRLPKAIQCLFSNYRGARTTSVPEPAMPDVAVRLAGAAALAGRLPEPGEAGGGAYGDLAEYLDQHRLWDRIGR
ncbi:MAG TPA: hypothetical protein VOB72_03850 [Candidatus Dormibacteraeota bacterium]|nr:hypothetical protein [Candidatus Dormibacteraeota bacterium]